MVVELSRYVGQYRIDVKTIFNEREALYPFHGKE
jgi:hypothetical protein